jgi:hypothetical protein
LGKPTSGKSTDNDTRGFEEGVEVSFPLLCVASRNNAVVSTSETSNVAIGRAIAVEGTTLTKLAGISMPTAAGATLVR